MENNTNEIIEEKVSNIMENEFLGDDIYENLPEILKSVTSNFKGRERDIVLLSSIGVLSNCIPNVYGYYDGDEVYANLFLIFIAPPASGKGVMNYSRILIQKIHDKILKESRPNYESCVNEKKKKKEKDFSTCPQLEIKVVPANISSAEMYSYIGASQNGVLIIESEADTMSNMLKNDWSNYSDVLRAAFHHEQISVSRKLEKLYLDIDEPKLSIVMSGTPNQLKPLMQSKENGLFSRFIMYTFNDIPPFKNVFDKNARDNKMYFENASEDVYTLYGLLKNLENKKEFQLTDSQNEIFIEEFKGIHNIIMNNHPKSFISNLNRHGIILFRLCMILTVFRNDSINEDKLMCNDIDFYNSLKIVKILLKHALLIHNNIDDNYFLSISDENFLFALKSNFTRSQAIEIGKKKFNLPVRTIDDKFIQWQKKKAIIRTGHGKYQRILNK